MTLAEPTYSPKKAVPVQSLQAAVIDRFGIGRRFGDKLSSRRITRIYRFKKRWLWQPFRGDILMRGIPVLELAAMLSLRRIIEVRLR